MQDLVVAISAAGGPSYSFFDVAPVDGTSGGVSGGNIRNAFLCNPERVSLDGPPRDPSDQRGRSLGPIATLAPAPVDTAEHKP
jgi:hypothetical protein